jgi:Abnormal spindle-like microcephaly-assoc'd, ASPM-SPD-2-Hydin
VGENALPEPNDAPKVNALPGPTVVLLCLITHKKFADYTFMRSFPALLLLAVSFAIGTSSAQQLQCKPCWYVFPKTQVGQSTSYTFQLANVGTRVLEITSITSPGNGFSLGSVTLPASIQPGQSIALPVVFAPAAVAYDVANFTITSNDPSSPRRAQVAGAGISTGGGGGGGGSTQLSVSPSTLNFGNVTVGSTASLQATLTASNGAVTISEGETSTSEFAITGLSLPLTISAGQSVQATIQFTPNASGTASAQDQFVSNATNSPSREQLTGTGVAQTSHSATLSWQAGASSITGYNVYRGTTNGGPYSQINSALVGTTSYTDSTVVGGDTYYYVTTEINNQGQESGYSNVAEAQIPD